MEVISGHGYKVSKYFGGCLKVVKSKLTRIWGLALTVVLLVGLLVPAMATPVSASNLAYTNVNLPNNTTNFQLLSGTSASVYDIGPDGKIMFAYSNGVGGDNNKLFKSADGGNTWATTNLGGPTAGGLNGNTVTKIKISPQYATDTTVMAVVSNTVPASVWRSIDGGQTFGAVGGLPIAVGMTITSLDVSPYYNGGQGILVGWADGAGNGGGALFTTTTLSWTLFSGASYIAGDVVGVGFSPNHVSDAEYFAVVAPPDGSTQTVGGVSVVGKTILEAKLGGNQWNNDVMPGVLTGDTAETPHQGGLMASLAFPSDYDWSGNNRVFVGLGSSIGTSAGMDVFRVNATLAGGGTTSRTYDLNANGTGSGNATSVASVAFKGPLATGTLVVTQFTSLVVNRSTNAINNSPDWFQSTNNPVGVGNPQAKFSPTSNTLYVGTAGTHSAISTSTDYNNFAAFSMVSVRDVSFVRVRSVVPIDANTWFAIITDRSAGLGTSTPSPGDYQMIFKTTNAGTNWQLVWTHLTTALTTDSTHDEITGIYASATYATDQTVYLTQSDYRIWKISDGGASWVGYTAPNNVVITAFTLVDANTYFVGSTAGVYKVGNYTAATLDGRTPNSFMYVSASEFFLGTKDGYVYMSTDNGSTWQKIGSDPSLETSGSVWLAMDIGYATNKIIYATNNGSNCVYRFTVGTSASFEKITNGALVTVGGSGIGTGTISSITRSADNSLYVMTNQVNAIAFRNPNPTVAVSQQVWEPIGPSAIPNNNGISGFPMGAARRDARVINTSTPTTPSNTILVTAEGTPLTTNGYNYQLLNFQDTLVTSPAIVAPKANAQVAPQSTFSWTPITSPVTLTYEIQIATDNQFQGVVVDRQTQASSYYANVNDGLVQGQNYFWRVFVAPAVTTGPQVDTTANTNPFSSKKPAAIPFVVKLGTVGNDLTGNAGSRIAPAAGATNVPIRPTFEWAPVTGADSYEMELADNPFFANSQAKKPLQNTVWTWDKDLTYSTTYYWRVRAVAAGNASDWVSSVFTTRDAPSTATSAPAATVTVTPPPAPKFFDPQSGLYFNSQAELQQYQAAHPAGQGQPAPATPAYIWVIIVIGAVLVIAVIVLIARTRKV